MPFGFFRRHAVLLTVVFWLLAASSVFFWRLGASAIPNWDEGTHAIVTHEMRERGDWMHLTYLGSNYFRKPPLAFWFRGATEAVFGETEWTVRLPSAIAGLATAALLALWMWQWQRRLLPVHLTLLTFLTSRFPVIHVFRSGETDGLLGFFLVLALYAFWRSLERPRWLILGSVAVGLAVMTKSVAGLVPFVVLGAYLLVRRRSPYRWSDVLWSIAAFLTVTVPWHAVMLARYGRGFVTEYLGLHVIERTLERFEGSPMEHGPFWYVRVFVHDLFPWSAFAPAALVAFWIRLRTQWTSRGHDTLVFLLVAAAVPFVLYSIAATKLAWYILPTELIACLLLGAFGAELLKRASGKLVGWVAGVGALTAALATGFFQPFGLVADGVWRAWLAHPLSLPNGSKVGGLVALLGIACTALLFTRRFRRVGVTSLFIVLGLSVALITSRRVSRIEESNYRRIAIVATALTPTPTFYVYDVQNVFHKSARYYLGTLPGRTYVALRGDAAQLVEIAANEPGAFVIAKTKTALSPSTLDAILVADDLTLYRVR